MYLTYLCVYICINSVKLNVNPSSCSLTLFYYMYVEMMSMFIQGQQESVAFKHFFYQYRSIDQGQHGILT